jgi:hypothetical protein
LRGRALKNNLSTVEEKKEGYPNRKRAIHLKRRRMEYLKRRSPTCLKKKE